MYPNRNNFCGGNFQDWLEVNLTEKCNGKCSWCIERSGFHPTEHADWHTIAEAALATGKKNIMLLGGEPTLYPYLRQLARYLKDRQRDVCITTNGCMLYPAFIQEKFQTLEGKTTVDRINISIHDYDLEHNRNITGIRIKELPEAVKKLHHIGTSVRFNCNCIVGHIDTAEQIYKYIRFAKAMGADAVRFAELKLDKDSFVDLAEVMGRQYGLNDDPFTQGCHSDAVIDGMPVNFRQMCGLQTDRRPKPIDPVQFPKNVLYYDGKIYNGWQMKREENTMKNAELAKLLEDVAQGKISPTEAAVAIGKELRKEKVIVRHETVSSGCQY